MADSPQDTSMLTPPSAPAAGADSEPRYGGFTRFELELEFVQSLASPSYLYYLASNKFFEDSVFVAYLSYLQYFTRPPYTKYLTYPGPTLRHLELLQQERFRTEVIRIDVLAALVEDGMKASMEWVSS